MPSPSPARAAGNACPSRTRLPEKPVKCRSAMRRWPFRIRNHPRSRWSTKPLPLHERQPCPRGRESRWRSPMTRTTGPGGGEEESRHADRLLLGVVFWSCSWSAGSRSESTCSSPEQGTTPSSAPETVQAVQKAPTSRSQRRPPPVDAESYAEIYDPPEPIPPTLHRDSRRSHFGPHSLLRPARSPVSPHPRRALIVLGTYLPAVTSWTARKAEVYSARREAGGPSGGGLPGW